MVPYVRVSMIAAAMGAPVLAQPTDDFDDGMLDGWSDAIAYHDAEGAVAMITFDGNDGELVMTALTDNSDGDEVSGAYLVRLSTDENAAYANGSASVDVHSTGIGDDSGFLVRTDVATNSAVAIGMHKTEEGLLLFINLAVNNAVVGGVKQPFFFDGSDVHLDASWADDQYTITASQIDGPGTATLTWTNGFDTGGHAVALLADDNPVNGTNLMTRFDNFSVVSSCAADCDGNGLLNILDFVCFQDLFASGDPGADCTGDGTLNILDFVCFQDAFSAGCGE